MMRQLLLSVVFGSSLQLEFFSPAVFIIQLLPRSVIYWLAVNGRLYEMDIIFGLKCHTARLLNGVHLNSDLCCFMYSRPSNTFSCPLPLPPPNPIIGFIV